MLIPAIELLESAFWREDCNLLAFDIFDEEMDPESITDPSTWLLIIIYFKLTFNYEDIKFNTC
jgi:hypothetical protein